ncbi:hypothetical protein CEXT_791041 [Caerostris extrusa]|uniref:Uncharacterized protein n=1 Tax=Caerostris extrusa TaxID=172846 RepID=A0AAV4V1U7_CAEEX|nr:hypothetical protein CEXT_791041 [Caerostris extrusa]
MTKDLMKVETRDSMRVKTRRGETWRLEERKNNEIRRNETRKDLLKVETRGLDLIKKSLLSSSKSAAILLCLSFAKDYSVKAPEILLRSKEADSLENKRFLSTPKSSAVWKKSLSRQKNTPPLIFSFYVTSQMRCGVVVKKATTPPPSLLRKGFWIFLNYNERALIRLGIVVKSCLGELRVVQGKKNVVLN